MKLFIVRHGDSPFGTTTDHQRTLSLKGKMQAQKTAHFIAEHKQLGEIKIIASDAIRTLETAKVLQENLNDSQLMTDYKFYGARVGEWCDAIFTYREKSQLVLVGHNPTMTMLCQHLASTTTPHFTPACVAYFKLEINNDGLKLPAILNAFYSPDAT